MKPMNWDFLTKEIHSLAQKIEKEYLPDVIVGIVRGGIIPAQLLSTELGENQVHCISVTKDGKRRRVVTKILEELVNKNVLLVEDALESGRSLIEAKRYLESTGANVKTACLYYTSASDIVPDFYLRKVARIPKFPWE